MTVFVAWPVLMLGVFFCIVGGIGIVRMPDFYTRTHAASLTDTLGAYLIIAGLLIMSVGQEHWQVTVKLIMTALFLFITSPTASHALVKSAFERGPQPILDGDDT